MHYPKDLAKADTDTQNSVAVASLNVPSTDLTSTNKCQANNNSEYQCPGVLLLNSMQIQVDARLHVHFCECVRRCMLMCVLTCFSCRLLALCLMGVSGGWTTASLLLCPAVPQPLNSYQLEESGGHTHTNTQTFQLSVPLCWWSRRGELSFSSQLLVTHCWRHWRSSSDTANTQSQIHYCILSTSTHTQKTSNYINYTLHDHRPE